MLMIGPSGAGETMLANRLPTIIPPLTLEETLETTKIHSVAGKIDDNTALLIIGHTDFKRTLPEVIRQQPEYLNYLLKLFYQTIDILAFLKLILGSILKKNQ